MSSNILNKNIARPPINAPVPTLATLNDDQPSERFKLLLDAHNWPQAIAKYTPDLPEELRPDISHSLLVVTANDWIETRASRLRVLFPQLPSIVTADLAEELMKDTE